MAERIKVQICRPRQYYGFAWKLKVFLDEELAANLANGQGNSIETTPGSHIFYIQGAFRQRSVPLVLELTEPEPFILEVSMKRLPACNALIVVVLCSCLVSMGLACLMFRILREPFSPLFVSLNLGAWIVMTWPMAILTFCLERKKMTQLTAFQVEHKSSNQHSLHILPHQTEPKEAPVWFYLLFLVTPFLVVALEYGLMAIVTK